MAKSLPDKDEILEGIRQIADTLGHLPSFAEFQAQSGISEYQVLMSFRTWNEAVRTAGLEPNVTGVAFSDADLLIAWGQLARKIGQIPTMVDCDREGIYVSSTFKRHFERWSAIPETFRKWAEDKPEWADVLAIIPPTSARNLSIGDAGLLIAWGELARKIGQIPTMRDCNREGMFSSTPFKKHFGHWSAIPEIFRKWAEDKPEWADILAIIPPTSPGLSVPEVGSLPLFRPSQQSRFKDRPVYGNPINFRGLRHEPVNENGVVFLFGMVARELGFLVEAVQAGFPDCEAKREIDRGKWQRVRIEFEFESRNFRDHGHAVEGCDMIVCWHHNWSDCPLEVLELKSRIESLSQFDK